MLYYCCDSLKMIITNTIFVGKIIIITKQNINKLMAGVYGKC